MIDHNMPSEVYHANPSKVPSLSASIAGILYGKSPLHAWHAHPKLNPNYMPQEEDRFDLGTCAHAVLLEGHADNIAVLDFPDRRTKAYKDARDAARSLRKTPILKRQMEQVMQMAAAAEKFIADTELRGIFSRGKPEVSLMAEQNGIHLRSRLDYLTDAHDIILDLKTTEGLAKPESFIRGPMRSLHYDLKAEFYKMMVKLETGKDAQFFWLIQETEAPFACSLVGMAPSMIELGQRKLDIAMRLWKQCMEEGKWPGYDSRIAHAEAEAWQHASIDERELNDVHVS